MSYPYLLSVRLMVYNHENYIREAIEGILIQKTNFPIEVVIGDDFSTDKSLAIIKEYQNTPQIHFKILDRKVGDDYWIKRQKLGRLYNFFNILENCSGKYIALLEGDDYWTDPLKLQKQVDFLEKNKDYIICGHDAKIIDSDGNLIKESKLPNSFKRDAIGSELKKGFWILTLSMVFRNLPIFKNFPKEVFFVSNGDTFLISVLGQFGMSKFMPEVIPASYRVHGGGIWSMKTDQFKSISSLNTYMNIAKYYKNSEDPFSKELLLWSYTQGYFMFTSSIKKKWDFSYQLKILKITIKSFYMIKSLKYKIKALKNTVLFSFNKNLGIIKRQTQ